MAGLTTCLLVLGSIAAPMNNNALASGILSPAWGWSSGLSVARFGILRGRVLGRITGASNSQFPTAQAMAEEGNSDARRTKRIGRCNFDADGCG